MPTSKELQSARKKLKSTPKPKGNSPKIPTAALLRIIKADPKVSRNKEFMKRVHELTKKK
jgi:hypothetical protein